MKRKIKINNKNFKYKFKIFVLACILVSSVYLLYFNDKILVQSIVQNSLHNEGSRENFDVHKYVDICKTRKTRFYNFTPASRPFTTINIPTDSSNNCENLCDTTQDCQFFIMNENDATKCYLYSSPLDSSNIDTNSMNIKVNCNSTILPSNSNSNSNVYNGYGYVNKNYFKHNKNKFTYKDAYLEKANELIPTLKANRLNLNAIAAQNGNNEELATNATTYNNVIGSWIDAFSQLIGFDRTELTTESSITNIITQNILDDDKNKALKKLATISKDTPELDNKLSDIKSSGYANNLFYTILAFIMIITIILLILYKFNTDIISDRFMIFYFIIIVILFMFIHFMLK